MGILRRPVLAAVERWVEMDFGGVMERDMDMVLPWVVASVRLGPRLRTPVLDADERCVEMDGGGVMERDMACCCRRAQNRR
jgi:hypothetical protein